MAKEKKTLSDLSSLGGMVYSTNAAYDFSEPQQVVETLAPARQKLIAAKESKGRAGKTVTIVSGFAGSDDDLQELAKALKRYCGVGGTTKDREIVIQGDFRDKAVEYLSKKGYGVKKSGS